MSLERKPRQLASALPAAVAPLAPRTPLAAIQAVWAEAVGDRIATEAAPVSERDGVVTVACRSASWAQQLDLLAEETLARVRAALPAGVAVEALRFRADRDRFQ